MHKPPSPGTWTAGAALAIDLCEQWAAKVVKAIPCQLYLFGSAIYRQGEQFDPAESDVDIICQLPDQGDALSRFKTLQLLYQRKHQLELSILAGLHRPVCDEPCVSLVAATPLEVRANIHKSAVRNFFERNYFYNLLSKQESFGLLSNERQLVRNDSHRQAFELVQRLRNEYLAVSANATGGLRDFAGADPLPKALLRSAAQLTVDAAEGEWYDTRRGLDELYELLSRRRAEDTVWRLLFHKISVRRGGRGKRESLSRDDQLLLGEMLFDRVASVVTPEDLVNWSVRIPELSSVKENVQRVFAAIIQIVPEAQLIGWPSASDVMTIRSSATSQRVVAKLDQLLIHA